MMLHRAKVMLGVVTAGVTALLCLPTPASASQLSLSKASDPNGPFCTFYKNEASSTAKSSVALDKAIQANNWPKAKKDIIGEFGTVSKLENELVRSLASAPANVRAAATASLRVVPAEEKAVRTSTSVKTYEAAIEKLFETPKMQSIAKVFDQYETATCGTTTATT